MKNAPQKTYLKDYTPPIYHVVRVDLDICVFDEHTNVHSRLVITKEHEGDLVLFGRQLQLLTLKLNDEILTDDHYHLDEECLIIDSKLIDSKVALGEPIVLDSTVCIYPQHNTSLEGLYVAGSGDDTMYVTQCEAQGFRKITFYPDRPDVLSVFTTRLEAPKRFKTLLANGNLIETGEVNDERHYAIWHDPTKKPSYLFACVIANLAVLTDQYTTSEGRDVLLEIYAATQDIDKCHVAMQALKDAMKWDEDNYGRAYDLDRYMIVATGQFNMGAMENKGLNIFNTSCVLSSPETTSDEGNFQVKAVIAHEYFHNWTGNRITCRDWFQLCLKEGLTVYRDQSFSADFRSPAVQRIDDVGVLRAAQFSEDAGALAHPARPDSFVTINNFYTATVYEKGAEIVRMMANWLGREKYRAGMDEYFRRHDGQAVTVEDFVSALASQDDKIHDFLQWYKQPATPVLSGHYDYDDNKLTIHLAQTIRHVEGYNPPKALPIVVDMAVFDYQTGTLLTSQRLLLEDWQQDFVVPVDLAGKKPLLSLLRGFSSPVIVDFDYRDDELLQLVRYETDGFNRWQAVQLLIGRYLTHKMDDADKITQSLLHATDELIATDPMLAARLFDIPSEKELAAAIDDNYDPMAVKARRDGLKKAIATGLSAKLEGWYAMLGFKPYQDTPQAVGERALRNVLLDLLANVDKDKAAHLAAVQYDKASCMSERFGALAVLSKYQLQNAADYLAHFYQTFAHEALVVDKWFMVQAMSDRADIGVISELMAHEQFDWHTPNRVRSVMSAVAARPVVLWSEQGLKLYLSALAKLDGLNPQLAARLLGVLSRWYSLKSDLKSMAGEQLRTFAQNAQSKDVQEVCQQLLDNANDPTH